ncbi:MAG: septum formation protein Maf [Nitrospiraceae bacterium]
MRLVLASTSPRRRELLALLQIPFEVATPVFQEHVQPGLPPLEQVREFAEGKARSCEDRFPASLILGSDTLIVIDSEVLGKPASEAEAADMLRRLSGREHVIHTAVALNRTADKRWTTAVETVRVWLRVLSDAEIDRYIRTGESMGKAGAYAIQGRGGHLIDRIEGDFTAAVGLPLRRVAAMLGENGLHVPIDLEAVYSTKPYPNWNRFVP